MYPWEDRSVRSDVRRGVSLRLPEPHFLKLRYIAENTPLSAHRFVEAVLLPAIDREVERLTEDQQDA